MTSAGRAAAGHALQPSSHQNNDLTADENFTSQQQMRQAQTAPVDGAHHASLLRGAAAIERIVETRAKPDSPPPGFGANFTTLFPNGLGDGPSRKQAADKSLKGPTQISGLMQAPAQAHQAQRRASQQHAHIGPAAAVAAAGAQPSQTLQQQGSWLQNFINTLEGPPQASLAGHMGQPHMGPGRSQASMQGHPHPDHSNASLAHQARGHGPMSHPMMQHQGSQDAAPPGFAFPIQNPHTYPHYLPGSPAHAQPGTSRAYQGMPPVPPHMPAAGQYPSVFDPAAFQPVHPPASSSFEAQNFQAHPGYPPAYSLAPGSHMQQAPAGEAAAYMQVPGFSTWR